MTFITGAFTATYDGLSLGTTEEGFEQITTRVQEEIRTDQYRGVIDGIFQGIDMQIRMVLMELDLPGVRRLLWPYDHDYDQTYNEGHGWVGPVGRLMSSMAAPLILTPCPGTSAALFGDPETGDALDNITYFRCVLAAESSSVRFSSSLRKLPVTLQVLPWICSEEESAGPTCDSIQKYYTVNFQMGEGPVTPCVG